MIEAAVTHTTNVRFTRPFAETYSSSAPHSEAIPDELRLGHGEQTHTRIEHYFVGQDSSQSWFWNEQWQIGEREAQEDIASRRGDFYGSSDAFLASF
jgi:hypothetical protein